MIIIFIQAAVIFSIGFLLGAFYSKDRAKLKLLGLIALAILEVAWLSFVMKELNAFNVLVFQCRS
jgi:hypothetical protein